MLTKSQRYGTATPPDDPEQEFMTVQESAYVLRCSVTWLRRFLAIHPDLCGRNGKGKKIVTDREQRTAIHKARNAGDPRQGRSVPRQRRRSVPRPARAAA